MVGTSRGQRALLRSRPDGYTGSMPENAGTQPLRRHRVFNNPAVLTEGWYPVCLSSELGTKKPRTFKILDQRLAVFRGADGRPCAVDAFCPHMGADLSNGCVEGGKVRCFFHGWRFDGDGALDRDSCGEAPAGEVRLNGYPVEEKYGFVWVFSGLRASGPVPSPARLDGPAVSAFRETTVLLAHHHLMMANGIDLRHFGSVHGLPAAFEHRVRESGPGVFDWEVEGTLLGDSLPVRVMRRLLGPKIGYVARFAGGSWVSVTYLPDQRVPGLGWRWPSLHLVWGCLPQESGLSRVFVFLVTPRRRGALGWLAERALLALSAVLLRALKDDDRRGFSNMRYSLGRLTPADASVAQFVRRVDELPISIWSPTRSSESQDPIDARA